MKPHITNRNCSPIRCSILHISDKMGESTVPAIDWQSYVQQLQDTDYIGKDLDAAGPLSIDNIKQDLVESGFLEQAIFPEIAEEIRPELRKICKDYALPSNSDDNTAIHARVYSTLTFHKKKYSDCYCKDPDKTGAVFADCQVLRGGNMDKTYYIALTHDSTVRNLMAGIGVLARFDPSVSKEASTLALLALWDLIRMLAKLENIVLH